MWRQLKVIWPCSDAWRRYLTRRAGVVRAVNHQMVVADWLIGREIVMELQRGQERAGYGEMVIKSLSTRLTLEYGKGYSIAALKNFRQFYGTYPDFVTTQNPAISMELTDLAPIGYPLGSQFKLQVETTLSWSHYRALMRVEDPEARRFYEKEAAVAGWNKRELERQIHTLYYQRHVARQRRPVKESAAAVPLPNSIDSSAQDSLSSQTIPIPIDTLKDPYVLEFLDLPDPAALHEKGLEGAIIGHLRDFLLELGRGFAFVARQKRLPFDGDEMYVDLVFYNCILKCYLLIDLKMGRLTAADVGQMDSYVRMFDDLVAGPEQNLK